MDSWTVLKPQNRSEDTTFFRTKTTQIFTKTIIFENVCFIPLVFFEKFIFEEFAWFPQFWSFGSEMIIGWKVRLRFYVVLPTTLQKSCAVTLPKIVLLLKLCFQQSILFVRQPICFQSHDSSNKTQITVKPTALTLKHATCLKYHWYSVQQRKLPHGLSCEDFLWRAHLYAPACGHAPHKSCLLVNG